MEITSSTEKILLIKSLEYRANNTLHGINPYTIFGHIIGLIFKYEYNEISKKMCVVELKYEEYESYKQKIELNCGVPINLSYSYGGIEVKFTYRNSIPQIINALLQSGLCIKMDTKLQSFYTPENGPFSLEKSEQLALQSLYEVINLSSSPKWFQNQLHFYADQRLWKTEEGKNFAKLIREKFPESVKYKSSATPLVESPFNNKEIDFPITNE